MDPARVLVPGPRDGIRARVVCRARAMDPGPGTSTQVDRQQRGVGRPVALGEGVQAAGRDVAHRAER
jgi:hypothetical protein